MSLLPPLSPELIQQMDVPGPRYTSYPTIPEWSSSFDRDDYIKALQELDTRREPFGLYVHVPFCERRCSFCGCNVVVTKSSSKADRYLDYLEREMDLASKHLRNKPEVSQMHWGGGTPTFLREHQLLRLYGMIISRFHILKDAENSIEVDPTTTTAGQIELLSRLGFNRLSLGVQDIDENVQASIHRQQSFEATQLVVESARSSGFSGINFDLIYGLPGQTPATWQRTLDRVIELAPDRLAIFSFAYVPKLRPHQRRLETSTMPVGPEKHQLFQIAYNQLQQAGYTSVGMDHFALKTDELAQARDKRELKRNFQGYSARVPPSTVAFGLTAISDVAGRFVQNAPQMNKYEAAIDAGELPVSRGLRRSQEDRRREQIIQSLMCNLWVDLSACGHELAPNELQQLKDFEQQGLVTIHDSEITVTQLGSLFVRNLAMVFDSYLSHQPQRYSRTI